MKRHGTKLFDGSLLALVTLVALFYAYEIDVFANVDGAPDKPHTIELDEVLAVSALFCGGLTVFSIRRLQEARRETARRLAAEREARTLALHDPLTGLPNRRQFDAALGAAVAAPPRAGASHAVFLLDLNGFKRVNDVFGHPTGDDLLIQVGARLGRAAGSNDLVARLGGDEFAVLSPHMADPEAATGLALRLMEALASDIRTGTGDHRVGTSIGLSLFPQDGDTAPELLRKADIALYRAKADKDFSPSSMRFFEPGMDAQVRERAILERELRAAIASETIRPFYQPMVKLDTAAVEGFETLARWHSPVLGIVEPARFLALAADLGLIGQLAGQLLERSCIDARAWPKHVKLAFNLSGPLVADATFSLRVLAILARTGLEPGRLELEITESALVRDLETARRTLGSLREAGVRVAVDDFGTGYSSLYHLRAFKVDKIKIDRSFVRGMTRDADSAAIVRALVGLGVGLGLQVAAEGVETAEQERLLRNQGCAQAQGYRSNAVVDAAQAREIAARGAGQRSGEPRPATA